MVNVLSRPPHLPDQEISTFSMTGNLAHVAIVGHIFEFRNFELIRRNNWWRLHPDGESYTGPPVYGLLRGKVSREEQFSLYRHWSHWARAQNPIRATIFHPAGPRQALVIGWLEKTFIQSPHSWEPDSFAILGESLLVPDKEHYPTRSLSKLRG